MKDLLSWSLDGARRQTLSLAVGISPDRGCAQRDQGEHHAVWILGHLLLGDVYLLTLLDGRGLPNDFPTLRSRYGPGVGVTADADNYDPFADLVSRLTDTGAQRHAVLARMAVADLVRPTPDPRLARSQPTLGHHLHALVCHEGYHAGQFAAWRRRHGLASVGWAFAPG